MSTTNNVCSSCGGTLAFSPKKQNVLCQNCGTEREIQKNVSSNRHPLSEYESLIKETSQEKTSVMDCKSCGATIEMGQEVTSGSCPYCGVHVVLADKAVASLVPDGVRPFIIDQVEAKKRFGEWISKRKFAPSALKNLYQTDKMIGVYIPYWNFDADANVTYKGEGGKDNKVTYTDEKGESRTKTETTWEPVSGSLFHSFKNKVIRASKTLKNNLLKMLGGFKPDQALEFNGDFLMGYGSEVFQIPMREAYREMKESFNRELITMAEADVRKSYDKVQNITIDAQWSNEFYRLLLLPIYATAYTFQGKVYNVLINGETGQISGESPTSKIKVLVTILIIILVLASIVMISRLGK